MPGPSSTGAVAHAVRLGVRRGWTEFMLSVRSSQDQWFYLFTAFLAVGYLYLRRDTPVDDTGLLLPSVALPSILAGLIAFGLVIGPAYSLAMEKEDGTLLRAKAVPNGLVGYFAGQLVLHSASLVPQTVAVLVPSFDDVDVIEGQGSAGIEILAQLGASPDKVLVPCGGGGLSAGIALALPEAEIVTVEPEGWDDMARSIAAGEPVPVAEDAPPTRCDALQTKLVSPLTLGALAESGARGISVSEAEVERAVAFAARHLRLVVEPGGVVALAALLAGKAGPVSDRTVVVVSGGNVDPALYAAIIAGQSSGEEKPA